MDTVPVAYFRVAIRIWISDLELISKDLPSPVMRLVSYPDVVFEVRPRLQVTSEYLTMYGARHGPVLTGIKVLSGGLNRISG